MIAVTFHNYVLLVLEPHRSLHRQRPQLLQICVYNPDFTYRSEVQTFLLKATFKIAY